MLFRSLTGSSELQKTGAVDLSFSVSHELELAAVDASFENSAFGDDDQIGGIYVAFEITVYAQRFVCPDIALELGLGTDNGLDGLGTDADSIVVEICHIFLLVFCLMFIPLTDKIL